MKVGTHHRGPSATTCTPCPRREDHIRVLRSAFVRMKLQETVTHELRQDLPCLVWTCDRGEFAQPIDRTQGREGVLFRRSSRLSLTGWYRILPQKLTNLPFKLGPRDDG